uniref:Uncharacterized protein n=1 Tax=Aegilops tauschii subsp. strangulata TaxID=200361 RepID=A0A452ZVY6_AEGTS
HQCTSSINPWIAPAAPACPMCHAGKRKPAFVISASSSSSTSTYICKHACSVVPFCWFAQFTP